MASSLSSVVSDLVRTQMGASSSNSATEEDLDRHVAELIVREAKKKAEMYMQSGIRAYTTNNLSDNNAPRTNKRFLSSIIKSTDEHNKTILKAQARAAEELKRERREQERRQRRLRAEEAAAAERLRRKGKQRKVDQEEGWDRWDGRTAERKKVSRNWETWDGYDVENETVSRRTSSRKHRRSRSRDRKKRSSRDKDDKVETRQRRRHHSSSPSRRDGHVATASNKRKRDTPRCSRRSGSPSPSPSTRSTGTEHRKSKRRRRSKSPKYALDDLFDDSTPEPRRSPPPDTRTEAGEAELGWQIKQVQEQSGNPSRDSRQESPSVEEPSSSRRSLTPMTISRSPTPGPQPAEHVPSKMDRYFEESYDPRLDVEPLAVPRVPATGLINDADFEGWDAMLELIRLRREDKAEKKRLERLGLLPPKDKIKKKAVVVDSSAAVAERWNGEGVNVMGIEYNKKGTVREWDLGKEGLS